MSTWQELTEVFPDDPFVLEEVGEVLSNLGRFDEAIEMYKKLEKMSTHDPIVRVRAWLKMGMVEEERGDFEKAIAWNIKALELTHEQSWLYREAETRIESIFRRQENLLGLADFYKERLVGGKKDVQAALRLSEIKSELGDEVSALEWLEKASVWAPERHELQYEQANLLVALDRLEEAELILRNLTREFPTVADYIEKLGEVYKLQFEKGDETKRDLVVDTWKRLAPEGSVDIAAINRLGDLLRQHGYEHAALFQFYRAIDISPESFDLRERLALFLFSLERDERAWAILEQHNEAVEKASNYLRLAQFRKRYGKLREALGDIDKGLEIARDDYSLLEMKWKLLAELEEWDAALALFPKLLSIVPNEYFTEKIESRHIHILRSSGKIGEVQVRLLEAMESGKPMPETDFRLLARMALEQNLAGQAGRVFEVAHERYPQSFLIARLEADYWSRRGTIDEQVAAWRRLIELRPNRKSEWLRRIAMIYANARMFEQAREVAANWVAAYPTDPQAHIFYAEICYSAGWRTKGNESLRGAMRLTSNPQEISLRLAKALTEQGQNAKALELYEEAFALADGFSSKISLIKPMVELYLNDGQLENLVDRFKSRQRAIRGSANFHLYLAEIYLHSKDYSKAREELTMALSYRRNDSHLLNQLIHLAEAEQSTSEVVKYSRQLLKIDPGEKNRLRLARALLADGQGGEALAIIRANLNDFLKDPFTWRTFYPMFESLGMSSEFGRILQGGLERRGDDWKSLLSLAEFFISQGNNENAKSILWRIMRLPSESIPRSKIDLYQVQQEVSPMVANLQIAQEAWQYFDQISMTRLGNAFLGNSNYTNHGLGYGASQGPAPKNLAQGQSIALAFVGAIATQENQFDLLLKSITKMLDEFGSNRRVSVLTFLQLNAVDEFLREAELVATNTPFDDELFTFVYRYLDHFVSNFPEYVSYESSLGAIEDILLDRHSDRALLYWLAKTNRLQRQGKHRAAVGYLEDRMEAANTFEPDIYVGLANVYLKLGELEKARKVLRDLVTVELAEETLERARGEGLRRLLLPFLKGLLIAGEYKQDDKLLIGDMLMQFYQFKANINNVVSMQNTGQQRPGVPLSAVFRMPMATRYFDAEQLQGMKELANTVRTYPLMDEIMSLFKEHADSYDGNMGVFPRLLQVCFYYWNDELGLASEEAAQLLKHRPEDAQLGLLSASLLSESGDEEGALEMLDRLTISDGPYFILKLARQIQWNRRIGDDEGATKAALRLAATRVPEIPGMNLKEVLNELGLKDDTRWTHPQQGTGGIQLNRGLKWSKLRDKLRTYERESDDERAEVVARRILREAPVTSTYQNYKQYRQRALQNLYKSGRIKNYLEDLNKQLRNTPDSELLLQLLAEAYEAAPETLTRRENRLAGIKPVWLRLIREGKNIRAMCSVNGEQWNNVGSIRSGLRLPETVYVGVCSAGRQVSMGGIVFEKTLFDGEDDRVETERWNGLTIGRKDEARVIKGIGPESMSINSVTGEIGKLEDTCAFVYKRYTGNFDWRVKIAESSLENIASANSQTGLMVRMNLETASPNVALLVSGKSEVTLQYRRHSALNELNTYLQLASIRPGNLEYTEKVLSIYRKLNRSDELLAVYEKQLDENFIFALRNQGHDMLEDYVRLGHLSRLIENVFSASILRSSGNLAGRKAIIIAQTLEGFGQRLYNKGFIQEALRVWHKGLDLIPVSKSLDLRRTILDCIAEHNLDEDILPIIEEFLLVDRDLPAVRKPILTQKQAGAGAQYSTSGRFVNYEDTSGMPVLELLSMIKEGRQLKAFTVKVSALIGEDVPSIDHLRLLLLAQYKMRDLQLIDNLIRYAGGPDSDIFYRDSSFFGSDWKNGLVPFLIDRVKEWPGSRERILEALQLFERQQDDIIQNWASRINIRFFIMEIAIDAKRKKLAEEKAKEIGRLLVEESIYRSGSFDAHNAVRYISNMIVIEKYAEARSFIDRVENFPPFKSRSDYYDRSLKLAKVELDLLDGVVDRPTAVLWFRSGETLGKLRVEWEICGLPEVSLDREYNNDSQVATVFGRDFSNLDGKMDLEILVREDLQAEPDVRVVYKNVDARGFAELSSIPVSGYVQSVIHLRDKRGIAYYGPIEYYINADNLVDSSELLTTVDNKVALSKWIMIGGECHTRSGGVDGDQRYIEFSCNQRNDAFLEGERISIEPGTDYYVSAWIKSDAHSTGAIGVRFLDREGSELGVAYCNRRYGQLVWTQNSLILNGSNKKYPNRRSIPSKTAFLQPIIRTRGPFSWDDLYLGKVPEPVSLRDLTDEVVKDLSNDKEAIFDIKSLLSSGEEERLRSVVRSAFDRSDVGHGHRFWLDQVSWFVDEYMSVLPEDEDRKKDFELFVDLLAKSFPKELDSGEYINISGEDGENIEKRFTAYNTFPYTDRIFSEEALRIYEGAYKVLRDRRGLDSFLDVLANREDRWNGSRKVYAGLLSVVFTRWSNAREEAFQKIKQLCERNSNNHLLLFASGLAIEGKKVDEAIALVQQVSAEDGFLFLTKQSRLLTFAKYAGDKTLMNSVRKVIAGYDLGLLGDVDQVKVLYTLGLHEKAVQLLLQRDEDELSFDDQKKIREFLRLPVMLDTFDATIELAKKALGKVEPEPGNHNNLRGDAIRSLALTGGLNSYIDDLEKELEHSPRSVDILFRLAEAYSRVESDKVYQSVREKPEWPTWLKLKRTGNMVEGFYSADGISWEKLDRMVTPLSEKISAGIFVSSHDFLMGRAVFDELRVNYSSESERESDLSNIDDVRQWRRSGIGKLIVPGRAGFQEEKVIMHAATDRFDKLDDASFFLNTDLQGDGEIVVRILDKEFYAKEAKIGIMLREQLEAGSGYSALFVTQSGRLQYQQRSYNPKDAIPYFRQLLAIDPDNEDYVEEFLRLIVDTRSFDVGADFLGERVKTHLWATLNLRDNHYPSYFYYFFDAANRLEEAADLLLNQVDYTSILDDDMKDFSFRNFWYLGMLLEQDEKPDLATQLYKKGLEHVSYDASLPMRKFLYNLMPEDASQEVRTRLIEEVIFPNSDQVLPPEALPHWAQWGGVKHDGVHVLLVVDMLSVIEDQATLERFKLKLRENLASSSKVIVSDLFWLVILDVVSRDPLLEDDLDILLTTLESDEESQYRLFLEEHFINFAHSLVERLRDWPEAHGICYDLLDKVMEIQEGERGNYSKLDMVRYSFFRLAEEIGTVEEVVQYARDYLDSAINYLTGSHYVSRVEYPRIDIPRSDKIAHALYSLIEHGEFEKVRAYVKRLRGIGHFSLGDENIENRAYLESIEGELTYHSLGEKGLQATVWPIANQEETSGVRLVWEIALPPGTTKDLEIPVVAATGGSSQALENAYRVEILWGESRESMEPLKTFEPKVSSGTLLLDELPKTGFLRTILHRGSDIEDSVSGVPVFYSLSENLIKNPKMTKRSWDNKEYVTGHIPGWFVREGLLGKHERGGPVAGLGHTEFKSGDLNIILAEKIKVDPNKDYFQQAWIKSASTPFYFGLMGRVYLDASGREIKSTLCPAPISVSGWLCLGQVLQSGGELETGNDIIPAGTMYIQPFYQLHGDIFLNDLYFGVIGDSKQN